MVRRTARNFRSAARGKAGRIRKQASSSCGHSDGEAEMTGAVPELTTKHGIQLNERVSLRHFAIRISFADDARAHLESCLFGRVGCRGRGLAVVPVRLCRSSFQALTAPSKSVAKPEPPPN